jgi:hypothetical protein
MKAIGLFLSIVFGLLLIGCEDRLLNNDTNPPLAPKGLSAFALDENVEVSWLPNGENNIGGYNVFVSTSAGGKYQFIGSTKNEIFYDRGVKNGITYYYKVSAYDIDGVESSLSRAYVYATPRPEGYNVNLKNYRDQPALSGYDFSTNTIGLYSDQYTDLFFEYYDGTFYFDVWDDTQIQDMGYTSSLDDIIQSPTRGWSPTKDVRLIAGHTYVLQTWDLHYAKVRVIELSTSQAVFDWAYQLQTENTFLKAENKITRGMLTEGKGFVERKSK